jgi:small GTP-binding protein
LLNKWRVEILPENIEYLFKLVILGEGAVGKSTLISRYVYDSFEGDSLATIGTDIHFKIVDVDDTRVKLVIWDIAEGDEFAQYRKAFYQNTHGAFFIFDTTQPDTLERIDEWIDSLYDVTGPIPVVLLENKVDLETAISKENIKKIVDNYKVDLIRTSAKEGTNVEEVFKKMTKEMLKRYTSD